MKGSTSKKSHKMSEKKVKIVEMKPFDLDLVMERIGGLGIYQKRRLCLYTATLLFKIITSYSYIFTTLPSQYRCFIPQCDNEIDPIYWNDWAEYAVPSKMHFSGNCERYEFIADETNQTTTCYIGNFNKERVHRCDDFVFKPDRYRSIADDFHIYCDENYWKLAAVAITRFVALFLSVSIAGYLGDKYGRRKLFVYGVISSSALAMIKSFSKNYITFVVLEFIGSVCESGVFSSYFNFVMEILLPKHRIMGTFLMLCLAPAGEMLLGFLAWNVQSWRSILQIGSIPSLLLIVYQHLIPESPRWLISKGRYDEANQQILDMAEENEIFLTSNPISEENINFLEYQKKKHESIVDLFITKSMTVRFFASLACWLMSYFVSSGLFLTSVTIDGNMYVNFILISFMGIPANLILIVGCNKLGRRCTIVVSFFLNALLFTLFIVSRHDTFLNLCIYLVTKCATTISMHTLFVYTTEMFPTLYRQTITGYSMTFGRAGSLIGSLMPLMVIFWEYLPATMFAVGSIVGGLMALTLPETTDVKLPDSFADSRKIVQKNIKGGNAVVETRF